MFENDPKKAQDGGLAIAVFSELKGDLLNVFIRDGMRYDIM